MASSEKAKRLYAPMLLVAALAGGMILLLAAVYALPAYMLSMLMPGLAHDVGIDRFEYELRRVGLSGSDAAKIRISSSDQIGVSVPAIQIDYSLVGLMRKKIERLRIIGMTINIGYSSQGILIEGLHLDRLAQRIAAPAHSTQARGFQVDIVEINNALIRISGGDSEVALPASLEIAYQARQSLNVDIHLPLLDAPLRLRADIRPDNQAINAEFQLNAVNLKHFIRLSDLIPDLNLTGMLALEGRLSASLAPFVVTALSLTADYQGGEIQYGGWRLAADDQRPVTFKIDQQGSKIEVQGANLIMAAPISTGFFDIAAHITRLEHGYSASGKISAQAPALSPPAPPVPAASGLVLSGAVESVMELTPLGRLKRLSLEGKDLALIGSEIACRLAHASVVVSPETNISEHEQPQKLVFEGRIQHGSLMADNGISLTLPQLSVQGESVADAQGRSQTVADIRLRQAAFAHAASQLAFTGISGNMPGRWPIADSIPRGNLVADNFQWQGKNMGPVRAKLGLSRTGVVFSATNDNHLLPGVKLALSGESHFLTADPAETRIDYRITRPAAAPPVDLGVFHPESKDIQLDGEGQLSGTWHISAHGNTCSLQLELTDGLVSVKDSSVSVQGMAAKLEIPDLWQGRSLPNQPLLIKQAAFGKIIIEDGKFAFQTEPGGTVFIEKSTFSWCNGKVHGKSFRIIPQKHDYDLLFHCDSINFAELLRQFDIGQAEGNGTVNGSLPVRLSEGKVIFDNGFLYSTPGVGGTIRLAGANSLASGIPASSNLGQIDLALEALKEYAYHWVKLNLNTEAESEELMMRLQLDGKPVKPLPFAYHSEKSGFVRTDSGKASVFQGISLDVNFRLPLNKLLKYKDVLKLMP